MTIKPNTTYRFVRETQKWEGDPFTVGTEIKTSDTMNGYIQGMASVILAVDAWVMQILLEDGRIEEVGAWKPRNDEEIWMFTIDGRVWNSFYEDNTFYSELITFGNYFQTQEQAEKARDAVREVLRSLKEQLT